MKKLAILLSLLIVFSCEDKDGDKDDCSSLMAKADEAMNTLETKKENITATKADCDAAVAAMKAAVDCLPAGPEKTETVTMLSLMEQMCSAWSEVNTSSSY